MSYIWQLSQWPEFRWDKDQVDPILEKTIQEESRFVGKAESMFSIPDKAKAGEVLCDEILSSFSIEGISLDRESVRSSIARHLNLDNSGMEHIDSHTDDIVSAMADALENYDKPLTEERLLGWHSALFSSGFSGHTRIRAGEYRTSRMYIVSGSMGREVIHYEAPPAEAVAEEMMRFIDFFNNSTGNLLVKAAAAHLYFETIHPFADGNGRIGRLLAEVLLARFDESPLRYYSLSSAILADKKSYYAALEAATQGTLDITQYLIWFLNAIRNAVRKADERIISAIRRTQLLDKARSAGANERQLKMINLFTSGFEGNMTAEKWMKITKCSHATAVRDINQLIDAGILIRNSKGSRSTSYSLI